MENSVYTPGAGHAPHVLAGRGTLLTRWRTTLSETSAEGRVRAMDLVLTGPRGIGKTVTVMALADDARQQGFEVVNLQAVPRSGGLAETLVSEARRRLAEDSGPWRRAKDKLEHITGVSLGFAGANASASFEQSDRAAARLDAGAMAAALAALAQEVRRDEPAGGVLVTVDEVQSASQADLALLAAALHRLNVDHPAAVVMFAATGLPDTSGKLAEAGVTHADRLFAIEELPTTLAPEDALFAITEPARLAGVAWERGAAEKVVTQTAGFPSHIQLVSDAVWRAAAGPDTITAADADAGIAVAMREIERRTLSPRLRRMTDRQIEFMAALSLLGGAAGISQISAVLGRPANDLSWLRDQLLKDGDVFSPARGKLRLSTPAFGPYLLDHYTDAVADATTPVRSLAEMRAALPPAAWPQGDSGAENL
jgi:hypothetical protein